VSGYDSSPETLAHIQRVGDFMAEAAANLLRRASRHDASKLEPEERAAWDEATPKLATLEYGSDEYRASLRALKPTLDHHFAANDHHPEHHDEGIAGMSLLSLLEMLCDWRAASERTKQRTDDPDKTATFERGLEHNFERFGIEPQLASVLRNTAQELFARAALGEDA
jgi:hypothetical protein